MKLRNRFAACALIVSVLAACQGSKSGCAENEYSAGFERIGVLRSTDGGTTWRFRGNACFHAPQLIPVDPSPLAKGRGVALYFLDLKTLNQAPGAGRIIYRAVSQAVLEFGQPEPAFVFGEDITDPYVLPLAKGGYRMYLMHAQQPPDIISASSQDGRAFAPDAGYRTSDGAIPGALELPDGRVRLFLAGDPQGITSFISDDGLAFSMESGIRIPTAGIRVTDPHPIRLREGGYRMVYTVHPAGTYPDEQARLNAIEIHLADSADGFNWRTNPVPIAYGSVPGLVETADGTLYVYYVDASHRKSP